MKTRRTKEQIRKDNYNKDVDAYNFYVVNLDTKRAETGFEFREDAVDLLNDYDDKKKYKVVSKKALKTMGIENPNESFKYEAGGDFQSGVYAGGGEVRRFNRHEQMDSETREEVLDVLSDPDLSGYLTNCLYGLFDGYDYSQTEYFKKDMNKLKSKDSKLYNRVVDIYKKIDTYKFEKYDEYADGGYFDGSIPKVNTYMTNYAVGGSLEAHGIKEGDTFLRTISGVIQKVKDKNGKIVYINLANGERDSQPPLPFNKGGAVRNERLHVNKGEDYEVRYSKPRPQRKGYKGLRSFDEGGEMDLTDDKRLRVRKPTMPEKKLTEQEWAEKHNAGAYEYMGKDKMATGGGVEKINERDKVIYKDNVYLVSKIITRYVGGFYDVQYHLQSFKLNLEDVVVDDVKFIKKFETGGALVGNQKRIDLNKNGKIDAEDFKLLRSSMNGAWRNERKHVNHDEDYEVRYAKKKPNRTGYKGKRKFDDGGQIELAIKGYKEYTKKNWEGYDYFSEKYAVNELSELELDLRKLNDGKLAPSKVVGGGYKNAKKVAQDWLANQIKKQKSIIKTNGLSNTNNHSNFRSYLVDAKRENIINESKFNQLLDESNELIDSLEETYATGGGVSKFKMLSDKVARNYEGKRVKPQYQKEYGKVYSKSEAKEVGDKVAGKVKANQKMNTGGETKKGGKGGIMVLAKQIRKEGESWQDALKRAGQQLK